MGPRASSRLTGCPGGPFPSVAGQRAPKTVELQPPRQPARDASVPACDRPHVPSAMAGRPSEPRERERQGPRAPSPSECAAPALTPLEGTRQRAPAQNRHQRPPGGAECNPALPRASQLCRRLTSWRVPSTDIATSALNCSVSIDCDWIVLSYKSASRCNLPVRIVPFNRHLRLSIGDSPYLNLTPECPVTKLTMSW